MFIVSFLFSSYPMNWTGSTNVYNGKLYLILLLIEIFERITCLHKYNQSFANIVWVLILEVKARSTFVFTYYDRNNGVRLCLSLSLLLFYVYDLGFNTAIHRRHRKFNLFFLLFSHSFRSWYLFFAFFVYSVNRDTRSLFLFLSLFSHLHRATRNCTVTPEPSHWILMSNSKDFQLHWKKNVSPILSVMTAAVSTECIDGLTRMVTKGAN